MKVLLIGSGGREHAIAKKLVENPKLEQLYIAPGNPGTALLGENVSLSEMDLDGLVNYARDHAIDLTFVGPEAPLAAGIVDRFEAVGLSIVGPNQNAAQLESSKMWAKNFMKRAGIPTAPFEVFDDHSAAVSYLKQRNTYPIVIKADGLAAGKGVTVAQTEEEALEALNDIFIERSFKSAGDRVVIEDCLVGEEASIFAFSDGETILPMVPAQDHKAAYDDDKGPNTGGMGAYSPAPVITNDLYQRIVGTVFQPLLEQFKKEGIQYKGIVYAGIMIQENDPYVIEFNCRFGDPETQVVLPRLKSDLLDIFVHISKESLSSVRLDWSNESVVCVVMASGGYPGAYEKGKLIAGLDQVKKADVIHAGTRQADTGGYETSGGRVLAVVAKDVLLEEAIRKAYEGVGQITFKDAFYRHDIGAKALKHSNIT